ncbi:hypothetical protein LIR34_02940 [Blautia sp. MSK17_66]|nr:MULTISPECIES: hypothetical protein [Blautia]MCB5548784.1 hypothetical protein [Blautia sp. MSK17_66]NSK02835.1 hypothetical protein [Blautia obeum]
MKKTWKRLCTGFLALATVVTALPTTPVHAESKQYWTESAERVGIIEKVMNDGSIGSTFNEGYMKVEGETAYCIDINTDFRRMERRLAGAVTAGGVAGAVAGSSVAGKRAERKNTASKENRGNTTSSMGQRAGSKVGAVLDTKNKVKDKANAVKENIKDMPTQTAYAVYSAKEKAKSSVSDFKRGMVQEQQSRQTGRLEKQEQHRQNIADKRMELQKAQEARQAQRKTDGSATTGATRPHERPATASSVSKTGAEKMQEVKRPATATTSKISEPVKANVIKERPLSSGASDRKTTQPAQPVHRQNVEKVVSQETRQNDTKDRRTKVQQTQTVQKNQQTKEKNRSLVTKKGQKKK